MNPRDPGPLRIPSQPPWPKLSTQVRRAYKLYANKKIQPVTDMDLTDDNWDDARQLVCSRFWEV